MKHNYKIKRQKIYIVLSYNDTMPGKMIKNRAKLKFWNRYEGDFYSHVSLSTDDVLNNMMSFARKEIKNPFNAGLVKEDIRKEMFKLKADISKIAVMEINVSDRQYVNVCRTMENYWNNKEKLKFNFVGLLSMLLIGRGLPLKNRFFCSQWVTTLLKECDIDLFKGKKSHNIRPFDFYGILKNNIIYEGKTTEYPKYHYIL